MNAETERTANSWSSPAPITDDLVGRLRYVAAANNEASLCHPSLLTGAADEVERLRAALQSIVDFRPETQELGEEFWAEVDACEKCEVWRQRKHPIQSMCEDHVRRSFAVRDDNARSRAYQYLSMQDIARRALRSTNGSGPASCAHPSVAIFCRVTNGSVVGTCESCGVSLTKRRESDRTWRVARPHDNGSGTEQP